jgi:hypothetical protein
MPDDSPKTHTTTQSSAPWSVQQPYLQQAFGDAQKSYMSGGPQYYQGSTVAPLSDPSQAALTGIANRGQAGNPLNASAQGLAQQTINGDFLNSNPNFQSALDMATRGATQNFNESVMPNIASQFSASGRYGSEAHQDVAGRATRDFGQSLSDTAGQLAYQDYGNERTRQMQAMQMAPDLANQDYLDLEKMAGAGAMLDQYNQDQINADIDRWNFSQNQPNNNIASYLGLIGGGYGSTGTTTQPVYSDRFEQLAGAGLATASLFA